MSGLTIQPGMPEHRGLPDRRIERQFADHQPIVAHERKRNSSSYRGDKVGSGKDRRRREIGHAQRDVTFETVLSEPPVDETAIPLARRDFNI